MPCRRIKKQKYRNDHELPRRSRERRPTVTRERGPTDAMAEDEDDPAVFWPLFETTVNDEAEFGEDVGFVRDAMRCDAMR